MSLRHSNTFKYDPFGRRIEKISPTATSIFAYDQTSLVQTVNSTGGLVAHYTQTMNIDEPLALQRSGTTYYYEADGLGSITSLSSSAGALANTLTYDSFGNVTNSTGSVTNFLEYTGREFDTETGLYYYRARYYDPTAGPFLSEDPIGWGGGINLYLYVRNQVDVLNDSSGEAPNSDTKCLVCTVYAESRGTPSACQYGVASVILNRLANARKKGNKPVTICDIVSAPSQFNGYNNQNYKNCVAGCAPSKDQPDLNQTWKLFGQPFNMLEGATYFGNATPGIENYFKKIKKKPVPNEYCPNLVFYSDP